MSAPDDFDQLFDAARAAPAEPAAAARPPGADARKEVRARVKWAARVLLADGRVVPLRVRDVSETGIGLAAESPIAAHAVMRIAVAVPHLEVASRFTTVTGSLRTAHCTVRGPDLLYGGTWIELEPAGRDLIRKWIRRLRA
jgi:hypothetical protein